jgi:hypothetical protein
MTWTAAGYAGLAGIGVAIGASFLAPVFIPALLASYGIYSITSVGIGFM